MLSNKSEITGNQNSVIQGVNFSTITVNTIDIDKLVAEISKQNRHCLQILVLTTQPEWLKNNQKLSFSFISDYYGCIAEIVRLP